MNHPRFAEPRTKEQWRAYIDAAPPQRPAMPTLAEYEDMSPPARAEFNYQRNAYHSAGALVRTKAIERLHHQLRRRMEVNRYQPAGGVPPVFRTADQIESDLERVKENGWEIREIQTRVS